MIMGKKRNESYIDSLLDFSDEEVSGLTKPLNPTQRQPQKVAIEMTVRRNMEGPK